MVVVTREDVVAAIHRPHRVVDAVCHVPVAAARSRVANSVKIMT